MRLVPAIILAVAIVLAPVLWFFLPKLVGEGGFDGPAVDSGARIEIEMMRGQLEDLQVQVEEMRGQLSGLEAGSASTRPLDPDQEEFVRTGPNTILDAYAQVVDIVDRRNVNQGLQVASPDYLEAKLGRPREKLSDQCESMTNPALAAMVVLDQVGPVRVRMLQPAIDSLRNVFENIRRADPDLYARINTSGSLCVRRIRGTMDRLSTHSYGLAVDLNIDGHLDNFADGKTQLGLTILADFFRDEGWVWGAGFGREDSMHFEISRRQLDDWIAAGILGR